jgi:phospholipase/lecithinase/hemolysin
MKKQGLVIGIILATLLMPLKAMAVSLSGLYVFGDSLSDAGNTVKTTFNPLLGIGFPPPPYAGRFSNGPVWVEYLAQGLGLQPTLFADLALGSGSTEGINFAVGGATTGSDNTLALTAAVTNIFPQVGNLPGLQQQVDSFVNLIPGGETADPNALYVVWGGGIDYLPTQSTFSPFQTPEQSIANLTAALTKLDQAGAKNIMLVGLPPLGNTPLALELDQTVPGISDGLNGLVRFHNQGLQGIPQQLSTDVNLIGLDVNALFNEITSDPDSFGFTNLTTPCLDLTAGTLCSNPDQYLFWDQFHPTTAAHEKIAEFAIATLSAEPPTDVPEPTAILGLLAFGAFSADTVRRRAIRCNNL